jgi:pimeloyl-ACP methyl ester carboxylesterase
MQRHLSPRFPTILSLTIAVLLLFCLTPAQGYVLIFKDGMSFQGQIKQQKMIIGGPGAAFAVPVGGAPFWLDTPNKFITFSPSLLKDVQNDPKATMPEWMNLKLYPPTGMHDMPPSWRYGKVGDWNGKWERSITFLAPQGQFGQETELKAVQRITNLSPKSIRVRAAHWDWAAFYHPEDFGPELMKELLGYEMAKDKNKHLSKLAKCVATAQFLAECGWIDEAEAELKNFKVADTGEKGVIEKEQAQLTKVRANQFIKDLTVASDLGRYKEVQDRLETYAKDNLAKLVGEDNDLKVFEIKERLVKKQQNVVQAQQLLKTLPSDASKLLQAFFNDTAKQIFKELNPDSVDRLTSFVEQAEIYQQDIKAKRKPALSADKVLAHALTGWLLGNDAAEGNVELAQQLWQARDFVLKYQNSDDAGTRTAMRKQFAANIRLDMDLLARIIGALPPPQPHDKIDTTIQTISLAKGDSYLVQLPPEYHHSRPYPVLVVLHDLGETPEHMLKKWSKLAAYHGYILVAPDWNKGTEYGYTEAEQTFMMKVLRDMRKRFQVDCDRVFLFGLGIGAQMAFDVGLAHPDQFAGVLPMSGYPKFHAWNCRANAQYLPFYVVDGNMSSWSLKENGELFKNWVQWRFPAMLFEYKGRNVEWFAGEPPTMFDWMNRKKRQFPKNEAGSKGKEFGTLRRTDNHFYWISIGPSGFQAVVPNPQQVKWEKNWKIPHVQAAIFADNTIIISRHQIKQMTIWLAPGMVDFSKKVQVKESGQLLIGGIVTVSPKLEVLMEDFYERGDRGQLFLDRIDIGGK